MLPLPLPAFCCVHTHHRFTLRDTDHGSYDLLTPPHLHPTTFRRHGTLLFVARYSIPLGVYSIRWCWWSFDVVIPSVIYVLRRFTFGVVPRYLVDNLFIPTIDPWTLDSTFPVVTDHYLHTIGGTFTLLTLLFVANWLHVATLHLVT